jgi:hypothetical protein
MRRFLILVLLALGIIFVHAAEAPSLPSRDPAVVTPLLEAYRARNGPARITEILGTPEASITVKNCREHYYNLLDGTIVQTRVSSDKIYSIIIENSSGTRYVVIYALNKKWRRP